MANAILGRNFIKMMRPLLGLESDAGIVSLDIHADVKSAVTVDVQYIAKSSSELQVLDCETQEGIQTKKFIVEVKEATDNG